MINQNYANKFYFKKDPSDKNSNDKSSYIATMIEELKKEQNFTKKEIINVGVTLGKKIDKLVNQFKEIKNELKTIANALTKNKNYFC